MSQNLKNSTLLLALPLAFIGIPIYLNIGDFYALNFAVKLEAIGLALIFIRIFDIAQDLIIGKISDKIISAKLSRAKLISIAALLLSLCFFATFNPPQSLNSAQALWWFIISISLTYSCFNFCIINFETMVASNANNDFERISFNSRKEFFGLIGLILAFLIPTILQNFSLNSRESYLALSLIFAGLVAVIIPSILRVKTVGHYAQKIEIFSALKNKEFLVFLAIFLVNGIANSLPAANLIFYVRDVLKAQDRLGYFIALYFLSAAFSIYFWKNFAQKNGMIKTWIISISGAIFSFYFAYFLDEKGANYFYLICLSSGFFLGADLIIPPALIAKISAQNSSHAIAPYFALWNIVTKFSLMVAASFSLILLGSSGYQPGEIEKKGVENIALLYGAIPCFLKIIIAFILLKIEKSKKLFN
jgi:GPH family glycoside/pentoside/hexuronide:cation symporter